MKKTILIALVCFGAFACNSKNDVTPRVESDTEIVPYRKSTEVADLKVDLTAIEDGRCPANAICIWGGKVDLKFDVSDGSAKQNVSVSFEGRQDKDFANFSLNGHNYVMRITEVQPLRQTSESPNLEDYKVNVTIETK